MLQAVAYYVRTTQTWKLGLESMKALLVAWDGESRKEKLFSSCSLVADNMAKVDFIDCLFERLRLGLIKTSDHCSCEGLQDFPF